MNKFFKYIGLMAFAIMTSTSFATADETDDLKEQIADLKKQISDMRHSFSRVNKGITDIQMHHIMGDVAHIERVRMTGPALGKDHDFSGDGEQNPLTLTNPFTFTSYVFFPKDLDPNKKYPLLVFPHQGVHANFNVENGQLYRELIAQQYIIIAPDYRGSTGYGKRFYESIDYGGKEIADAKAARDYMVENYAIVDEDRVGIMGHSHGGLITLMNLFEYPDAYKVGFADVPVSDLIARMGYKTQGYRELYETEYHIGESAFENHDEYIKRSPAWNTHKLETPLMVYGNTNDDDVNILEIRHLVKSLKADGKDFIYKEFEDIPGAHNFARMDHKVARQARYDIYKFLEDHLSPERPFNNIKEMEKASYMFVSR
ncbi:alpha/beta hydrolase family protein [Pseudemcibacter aquimaris]|uniref:alpha/beta hydrolase family protein n=1 Tax=Pseudemcibacter aquimaris TaxID=2857064 RepID=UPI00201238BD|nr:prolyl oligopeptidase family serine peptidase [Pseudemcibacter aquimaris]MCC3861859.1 prolyl oligopeptidase family serine peptidase [Pseudemcibacter aquimaris]WDU58612.1 prolyl oligopeptidase family serine peptidase [Pseudemcibacter aquimaris]